MKENIEFSKKLKKRLEKSYQILSSKRLLSYSDWRQINKEFDKDMAELKAFQIDGTVELI